MKFDIQQSSGKEVVFSSIPLENQEGARRERGRWRIDMVDLEDFVSNELEDKSFGSSIETFYYGFEIADTKLWGEFFEKTKNYVSYRPKMKAVVSVGQIEWLEVKELDWLAQFDILTKAIISSINRVGELKRKPKDFNFNDFAKYMELILNKYCAKNT